MKKTTLLKETIMMKLLAIFVVLIALMGCDEGQQMMKPVMQPIIEEEPTIKEEPTIEYSQYDVDQDGTVGNVDLMLVSEALGQKNPDNPRLDVNRNGVIDEADLILIGNNIDLPTEETPVIEEPVSEEPIPEIVFTPEPPTREEPVDFQPLDTDRVFYNDADYLTGKFIFDDAGSAIKSEEVKSWFVFWEEWIREWCGKTEQPLWDDSPTLLFTNRQARVDFLLALPGKYDSRGGLENTDKESGSDDSLFSAIGYVMIVEGTPYFGMSLDLNTSNACKQ